jgi:cyclase
MQFLQARRTPALILACFTGLCAASFASRGEAAVQDDQSGTKLHAVAGAVKWIEGKGGNIAVQTGQDGPLVIDTQLKRDRDVVVDAISKAAGGPVRLLINTHWHGDHTGNNEPFGDKQALIVSHANVRARLGGTERVEGRRAKDTPASAMPDIVFDEALTLHWNGERIDLEHVGPAHTDGDAVVWFHGSKVVHMGDLFFAGRFPFVDLASGGSVRGLLTEVSALAERIDDTWTIIPGHGPVCGHAELVEYRDVLATSIERVSAAIEAGKDFETLFGEAPLDDFGDSWGSGFMDPERFLKILFQDLNR